MSRLARLDVPALLGRLGLDAKRKGREWWACCPFHEERSASWCMRDQPGDEEKHALWRCYGACEVRGGNAVGLVMRMLRLDRDEAWRWIWSDAKATPEPPPVLEVEVEVRRPGAPFKLPSGVILAPLAAWVTPARRYAVERGLTPAQVERWRLGFAVEGYLAGRLVLPVRNSKGKLVSYTGRTFVGSMKKWREPREEDGGDKGSVFGEEHWPPPGSRKRVVVTEAALDSLAVERVADVSIGAVYGSELLPGHVARLSTFEEVVVASDPDKAGEKFAGQLRGALGRWVRVRHAAMPEGYDANALEREDPARLAEALGL